MVNFSLINLILYNCLGNNIKYLMILHCWDMKTQLYFTNVAMKNNLYVQLWPIDQIQLEHDLKGRLIKHENPHEAIYFDMNCTNSLKILQKATSENLFKPYYHWLMYDSIGDIQSFRNLFRKIPMAVDADITLVMPNSNLLNSHQNSTFILYDVYNNGLNLGGKLNITLDRELACSRKACVLIKYLSSLHERLKYQHRSVMRDITLRVATVVTSIPLTAPEKEILAHLSSIKDKHIDGLAKFSYQNTLIIKDTLECNFRYNFSNTWSRTEINGGVIGAIGIENSADLASSPFLTSKNRSKYVKPLMKAFNFRQVCIFRTPQNAEIKFDAFLEPFALRVWVLFAVLLLLIATSLWLTFLIEFHKMKIYLEFAPSLLTTCLISFGSACCQGSFLMPNSFGGRIAFITLSLLTFIIYNYYTSVVVSILLGSPIKSNIKSMAQLADSKLEVGLLPIAYTKSYLDSSPLPEIKRFVRNKIKAKRNPNSVWINVDDGLRRVRDEPGYVLVLEPFSGFGLIQQRYTDKEICDLNQILFRTEEPLYQHTNINSSYYELFKLKQMRILESGVYRRHERLWVEKRLDCQTSNSFLVQVGWEYTAPLFIMLALVYLFVLILLMMEILWKRYELLTLN